MKDLKDIQHANDFEEYLRMFRSWGNDPHIYDFVLVATFFKALLDNIHNYANQGDLEDMLEWFTPQQRHFLIDLAERLRQTSCTGENS